MDKREKLISVQFKMYQNVSTFFFSQVCFAQCSIQFTLYTFHDISENIFNLIYRILLLCTFLFEKLKSSVFSFPSNKYHQQQRKQMKMDNMVKVNNKDTNDVIGIAQLQDRYIDSKIVPRSALCAAEVSCLVSAELLRLSLVD